MACKSKTADKIRKMAGKKKLAEKPAEKKASKAEALKALMFTKK
jgi:hypothetical protein